MMRMAGSDAPHGFSTSGLIARDRLSAYRDMISQSVGKFEVTPSSDEFRFEANAVILPGLSIAQISSTPVRVQRTREMATDGTRDLTLALFHSGRVTAAQARREADVRNGGAFLFSSRDELVMERSASRLTNYSLLRSDLTPTVEDIDTALMKVIPLQSEAIRLLTGYTGLLAKNTNSVSPAFRRLASTHIHDLIVLAIGATQDAAEVAKKRGLQAARRVELFSRAERFITLRFADANLAPGEIAHRLGVSTRLLQRIFAERGQTVMARLWEERVSRAARLLATPETADRSITDIAFACGFNDSSHFGRVFAAHKGSTPSNWRKQQRR